MKSHTVTVLMWEVICITSAVEVGRCAMMPLRTEDATGHFGRLFNHSLTKFNVLTKIFYVEETPHLIFVASRDVAAGEELVYDYGESAPEAIADFSWLSM